MLLSCFPAFLLPFYGVFFRRQSAVWNLVKRGKWFQLSRWFWFRTQINPIFFEEECFARLDLQEMALIQNSNALFWFKKDFSAPTGCLCDHSSQCRFSRLRNGWTKSPSNSRLQRGWKPLSCRIGTLFSRRIRVCCQKVWKATGSRRREQDTCDRTFLSCWIPRCFGEIREGQSTSNKIY